MMMPPSPHAHAPHASLTPPAHPGYGQPQSYHQRPPPEHIQPQQPNFLSMQLPPDASSTLYVEGLPPDATEREVSHIFRRFEGQGYQSIRMVARESSKMPGKTLFLCFVEFDNAHQATVAMHQLQGYRLDKNSPEPGVKIVYAKSRSGRGLPSAVGAVRAPPPAPSGERGIDKAREENFDSYESRHEPSFVPEYKRGGHRRDGREHSDSYHEDYEDSERGDDDLFQHADEVSMHGITD